MRSEEDDMTQQTGEKPRIVVGVDGSPESRSALRWAARFAEAIDARIEVVLVWEFVSSYGWSSLPPLYPPHPELDEQLAQIVTEVFGDEVPAGLTSRVIESGSAASALIAESKNAQLVVVGSRGHGGFAGLLLGSVSAKVAEHAPCPVLVVHGEAPPTATAA
jgi:nucleotide-binding universal stress UspA family protein